MRIPSANAVRTQTCAGDAVRAVPSLWGRAASASVAGVTRSLTILACTMTCVLVAAPMASAGLRQRITAANKVERTLETRKPAWTWVAACEQRSKTRFRCTFSGRRATRLAKGRAVVNRIGKRYVVKLGRITYV
jgi:hypothetical protein